MEPEGAWPADGAFSGEEAWSGEGAWPETQWAGRTPVLSAIRQPEGVGSNIGAGWSQWKSHGLGLRLDPTNRLC